ncbi:MAG: histidine kinase [Tannerella sp.]|jgi:sensor histidine kinase YesM|nr:histidine kinase [Tannerella sp.]
MEKDKLNWKTALWFAVIISAIINTFFIIMMVFYKDMFSSDNHLPQPETKLPVQFLLLHTIINFSYAFLLLLINFRLLRSKTLENLRHRWLRWLIIIVSVMVSAGVLSYICSSINIYFSPFNPNALRTIIGGAFRDYVICMIVGMTAQMIYLSDKQQKTALRNEMLQAENMKTRFMALKNQVDPHFLFNSLNTLNSLIATDRDKAAEYVLQLSSVFRYTLQSKEVNTLEEELNFTRNYCNLMQIRYGESLNFKYLTDEKYFACQVVPLSLQTLVENAIKHNVVSLRRPLTITIATTEHATVVISNPIQLKNERESGEGIGLSNLVERYRLMWKREISIRKTGGIFEVEIPLIQ